MQSWGLAARLALVATVCTLGFAPPARATGPLQVMPHVGYQFGGSAEDEARSASILSSVSYGLAMEYQVQRYGFVRASYHRQPTALQIIERDAEAEQDPTVTETPLTTGYLQLGGTLEYGIDRVRPIFGLTLGASHFTTDTYEEWYFSGIAEGAVKIAILDNLGLRAHARALFNLVSSTSKIFCSSTAGGCVYALGGELMGQGEVGMAIWVAF